MSYNPIVFDYALFQAQIPLYADSGAYPEVLVEAMWNIGTNFVSTYNCGVLQNAGRAYALNLVCAHLIYQQDLLNNGQDTLVLTAATVDKVNVSLQAINTPTSFNWWLSTSPYGKILRSLLTVKSAGGAYIGGSPTIGAFRGPAGGFLNGG